MPTKIIISQRPLFDSDDIDHLINRFKLIELRHELSSASDHERQADTPQDIAFWLEYESALELAISITKSTPVRRYRGRPVPVSADAVKARVDIVDIIGRDVKLRKAGGNFTGLCPFHTEKHASFYVFPNSQSWHCFGACSEGGDVISYVQKRDRVDFRTAISVLSGGARC